jgi:hypothetical protein
LTTALQSLADEKIGLTLASLPPLSRFFHLVSNPRLAERSKLPWAGVRCGGLSSGSADGLSSPRSGPPLVGLARLSEDVLEEASGLMGSPLPLWPWLALAFEAFASSRCRKNLTSPGYPLGTFRSPPEFAHHSEPSNRPKPCSTASHAVCSPSAS